MVGAFAAFGDYGRFMSVEPVIEIGGDEQLSPQQREYFTDSVRAMAMRSIEARDRAFEKEAATNELAEAVNRPLRALFEQDEGYRRVVDEARPLLDLDPAPYTDWLNTTTAADVRIAGQSFGPPFHFQWAWHRPDGSPPRRVDLNRPAGTVYFEGAAGPLAPGSGGRFVEVHAGFGVLFRPARDGVLVAESARRFQKVAYDVAAYGIGSWAVTEGGTECSILEQGQWKAGETRKRWRKRVSVNERETYESNLYGDGPMRHQIPVRAGLEYTFNVGIWLFVDNASGIGQSGALTGAFGDIPTMELTGP